MLVKAPNMLPSCANGETTTVITKLPGPCVRKIQPVGRWFEAFCQRKRSKQTLSYHSLHSSTSEDSDEDITEDEDDSNLLHTLDPRDWKNQDHYAVLGLKQLRYKATDDQIKKSYKKKVLKHHPDKRRARGLEVKEGDDDYFTCITRAWETLGNPLKRRGFDSVDPLFDNGVPSQGAESKEKFYESFGPVFERNARWSTKKRVPKLGDENSTFDEVNDFYSFWYDFDSWREYSYLDEEEKEKGENRDERRWIEKQNKAARKERKKEEMTRIRMLVDNASACDPRISKFKEEEKAKKQAAKKAKQDAARERAEKEEKARKEAEEMARKKKEEEEGKAKAEAAKLKKEKEAQKKMLKKERTTLRTQLKDFDYFTSDDAETVTMMQEVDKLAELLSLTSLQQLNVELTSGDQERAKTAFMKELREMNAKMEEEKQKLLEATQKQAKSSGEGKSKKPWSDGEMALLVKAVNLFPAGTVARWDTIANFITQHLPESRRTAKETLSKAKDLQKMDHTEIRETVNKQAYEKFEKNLRSADSVAKAEAEGLSKRFESVGEQQVAETGTNPAPWSPEEQKLLEQALRTYPASTPERWEQIASVLPSRSKKDCMKRYKELCELVKAKKAAAAAAQAKTKKT